MQGKIHVVSNQMSTTNYLASTFLTVIWEKKLLVRKRNRKPEETRSESEYNHKTNLKYKHFFHC